MANKRIKKVKHQKLVEKIQKGKKHKTKYFNQCSRCGRRRGYIRQFGLCRICFRELAHKGEVPGVTKSSW